MRRFTVGLFALWVAGCSAIAAPPRVVRAVPDFADIGVDPALKEIRIEFDQEMNTAGRSICGGGSEFPQIGKDAVWPDSKTIVIPVTLVGGKRYSLSVNCGASRNFASAKGQPAEEYQIQFVTRKEGEAARVVTAEEARRAEQTLRRAIDERYSYRDLRVKDWDAVFAERGKAMEAARTPSELARAAAKLMVAAEDVHVVVRLDGARGRGEFTLPTCLIRAAPNIKPGSPQGVTEFKNLGHVWTGMCGEIPYLAVTDWMAKEGDYSPALEFIAKHKNAPGMIVDVRMNSGGDEMMARLVAGRFTDTAVVYSTFKTREIKEPSGWSKVMERKLEPGEKGEQFRGKVAVLMGPVCMSSNESFILMMKHSTGNAGVKLVGARTSGASGNPKPVELGSGVTVLLPSWVNMTADGKVLEGKGIAPDVAIDWKESGEDAVLKAGAEAVRE